MLAAATGADELQVWKESAGVFTCNPTRFDAARMLDEIGFRELVELTSFGNDVVHPRAAALLKNHRNVEVVIKDVHRPDQICMFTFALLFREAFPFKSICVCPRYCSQRLLPGRPSTMSTNGRRPRNLPFDPVENRKSRKRRSPCWHRPQ